MLHSSGKKSVTSLPESQESYSRDTMAVNDHEVYLAYVQKDHHLFKELSFIISKLNLARDIGNRYLLNLSLPFALSIWGMNINSNYFVYSDNQIKKTTNLK